MNDGPSRDYWKKVLREHEREERGRRSPSRREASCLHHVVKGAHHQQRGGTKVSAFIVDGGGSVVN